MRQEILNLCLELEKNSEIWVGGWWWEGFKSLLCTNCGITHVMIFCILMKPNELVLSFVSTEIRISFCWITDN